MRNQINKWKLYLEEKQIKKWKWFKPHRGNYHTYDLMIVKTRQYNAATITTILFKF
jgi:hypothetical protein